MEGDSEMPSGVDNRNLVDSNSKAQGITREQIEGSFEIKHKSKSGNQNKTEKTMTKTASS